MIPEENGMHKSVRPVQSSLDQWMNSYCNRDTDESKRSYRINKGTSKALKQKQPNDEASDLKKGNQSNEPNMFKQGNNEASKAMRDDTIKLEEIKIHIREEIGSPQVNRKSVASMLDSDNCEPQLHHKLR